MSTLAIILGNFAWDSDSLETGEKTGEEWGLRAGNRQCSHEASVLAEIPTTMKKINRTEERTGQKGKTKELENSGLGNQWFFAEIGNRTQMLAQHLSLFVNTLLETRTLYKQSIHIATEHRLVKSIRIEADIN